MRGGQPAQSADFVQRGKKGISSFQTLHLETRLASGGRWAGQRFSESFLDQRIQRTPLQAGLLLGQRHQLFIHIQNGSHHRKLKSPWLGVKIGAVG